MSCKDKNCRCCVTKRGERGLQGKQGETGPQGIQGEQGVAGSQGPAGANGTDGVDGINGIIPDTGWVDLLGFDFYPGSIAKPQARRIGNMIHFRGGIFVPLSSDGGTTLVPLVSSTEYYDKAYTAPWTAAGGVTLNAAGSLWFNNQADVIPNSVLTTGTDLDNSYRKEWVVGSRAITLDTAGDMVPDYGTALTGLYNIIITNDRKLAISTVKDLESTSIVAAYLSSPLRYVTSNVRAGEFVPNVRDANSDIHTFPSASATHPVQVESSDEEWPFSCDAAEEGQIGGFTFSLDGLVAYVPNV
jgi:hypothetical protein